MGKSIESESRLVVGAGGRYVGVGRMTERYRVSFGVMKYSRIDYGDGCTTLNIL